MTKPRGVFHGKEHPMYKHGMTGTPLWGKWISMIQRCTDTKHHKYPIYGGRGIKISKEWRNFKNFYNDMFASYELHLKKYGTKNTTLDRIDNNGNYNKENCRWATQVEQALNRNQKVIITFRGQTKNMSQWADEFGINRPTLHMRIKKYGWSVERALTTF